MKRKVRRILSLVLILVMVCGMIPAASAAGIADYYYWDISTSTGGGLAAIACYANGGHTPYSYGYTTRCSVCGATGTYYGYGSGTGDVTGHTHVYTSTGSTQHQLICYSLGSSCPYYGLTASHTYSSTGYCSDCGYYYGSGSSLGHNHQYSQVSGTYASSYHYTTCTDSSCTYYLGNYEAHTGTPCYYCGYTGYGYTGNLSWSNSSTYCDGYYTPHTPVLSYTYGGYNYYTCGNTGCSATATGYATGTGSSNGYAAGSKGKIVVYGYDSMTDDTYTLNDTVTLSVYPSGTDSTTYVYTYAWSGDAYSYSNDGTAYLDTSGSTATAYCTVTAYPANTTDFSSTNAVDTAMVYWYATAVATDSIIYTALKGENVVLDADDFEEFWEEQYPKGTLSYVRFTSVSSGNLYDNYAGGTSLRTDVRSRNSSCYLSPSTTQIGLDDLTYVPSTYASTGTVTIQFTAYGTSNSSYNYNYGYGYGSSYGSTSLSGTITILYTAKEVTPIVYSITADSVTLDGDDFIAKYKEVMDVSYTGSLSIQFLEAPIYGTLSMSYGSSYWYQGNSVKLTDSNIGNYSFSTSTTGTYSIDNLTYTPGATSVGDTVRFACYSGSTLKFVGTVTFGASNQYTVELTTSVGKAVTFSNTDFNTADSSGKLTSGYLYLGTPNAGTLYKNYSNGTGTRVTTSDYFTAANLDEVTYVPRTGFVGVAEIPYTAYTYMGQQISGTIEVYVGRSFTDVLGTSSAWAAPYINKLSAQGIVNGTDTGMTKYSPTKTVTYGEALKLIMMAAGYPEQAKTSTHWASGYLTKAYYDGLVSSSAIDLNAEVDRDTIASITAKALDLTYATSVTTGITAPTDSTNGYVYALYNAGIVNGVNVGAYNYWYGSRSITRAEISKIICMVADYAEAN